MRGVLLVAVLIGTVSLGALVAAGCGDDDDDATAPASTVAAEPDPEPDPEAESDPEAEPVTGVVRPKSEGATQIDVSLKEWAIEPSVTSTTAGLVYFLATNEGPEDAHEFVVARTSRSLDELPIVGGRVDETLVSVLDEIEPFAVGSEASLELDLEPGAYVLLCNIAEVEGGELESHVELGMKTAFTVE